MTNRLLYLFAAIGCVILFFTTCSKSDDPSLRNCENSIADMRINNQLYPLKILSSTLLRPAGNNGKFKLLSVEAYIDTVKVLINVADISAFSNDELRKDSIGIKTYYYSRSAGSDTTGRVLIGIRRGQQYSYYTTDTASVSITAVNIEKRTVSGNYYLRTAAPVVTATGTFSEVCFLSIK